MLLPSYQSLKTVFSDFVAEEHITVRSFCNLIRVLEIIKKYRFLHYFIIGCSGVILNLLIIWLLTHFIFGLKQYFTAYLIGITFNLLYNFTAYTLVVFSTKRRHFLRLCIFIVYSLGLTFLQAHIIKTITPIIGLRWYLLVIASVIFIFSFLSFLIFKLSLFKEKM